MSPRAKSILTVGVILFLAGLVGGIYWFFLRGAFSAFLPTQNSTADQIIATRSSNDDTSSDQSASESPLITNADLQISVLANNIGAARDLQIDPYGNLLITTLNDGKLLLIPERDLDSNTPVKPVTLLDDLSRPHGIAFDERGRLYLAEETALSRYQYTQSDASQPLLGQKKAILELPPGDQHVTRSVEVIDGQLFVSIGSTCNVCIEDNSEHGSIITSSLDGENRQIYATGLRNAVFIKPHPVTSDIWATEMGRDLLGDDTPPDEINVIEEGGHYGWPYCYGNQSPDTTFTQSSGEFQSSQAFCSSTIAPTIPIQAHSAPLGLNFFPDSYPLTELQGDLVVAYHGSWNRTTPTGYKLVHFNLTEDYIFDPSSASQQDLITGWLDGELSSGRPVDIEFDTDESRAMEGTFFISDDKADAIYRVVTTK